MNEKPMRQKVMEAIERGEVRMRPRWHFALLSLLYSTGAVILFFGLVYAVSLVVFLLKQSGVWFLPGFGSRGWWEFFRALPWLIVALLAVFVVVLEVLIRKFAFVYRKSVVTSAVGAVALVVGLGVLLAETPLHPHVARLATHGTFPGLRALYRPPRLPLEDALRGKIIGFTERGFVIEDVRGTSSVILTSATRRPYGEDLSLGDIVILIGDRSASGTIIAFGIRELEAPASELQE